MFLHCVGQYCSAPLPTSEPKNSQISSDRWSYKLKYTETHLNLKPHFFLFLSQEIWIWTWVQRATTTLLGQKQGAAMRKRGYNFRWIRFAADVAGVLDTFCLAGGTIFQPRDFASLVNEFNIPLTHVLLSRLPHLNLGQHQTKKNRNTRKTVF